MVKVADKCILIFKHFYLQVNLHLVTDMRINEVEEFLGKREHVKVAYLFGSYAQGREGPLSDVDIAVLLDESLSESERIDLRLRLIAEISAILGIMEADKLDVIVMNDAPINLNYEIIKNGRTLLVKDLEHKIKTESKILSKYLDRRYYERRGLNEFLEKILKREEL
ncbi:MAG: Nucleotidyltransferase domain protein [Candidatus Bathyarchaeota archaeon BA1]|nr:MAG: Nucleotidyltransferase domain protein [Candidatus Bathyarchaeota archaeon BA1]